MGIGEVFRGKDKINDSQYGSRGGLYEIYVCVEKRVNCLYILSNSS